MKKYLFICLLGIFFNCTNQPKSEVIDVKKNRKEDVIEVKDSLLFNEEGKIIGVSHFENNIQEGFSLVLNEETNTPKYLVEFNNGKNDKILIRFYEDGKIESFGTAGLFNDSQRMVFHKNGVIKDIGNTVKGRADGIWYYFDEEGKLIKKVIYKKGQVVNKNTKEMY